MLKIFGIVLNRVVGVRTRIVRWGIQVVLIGFLNQVFIGCCSQGVGVRVGAGLGGRGRGWGWGLWVGCV